MFTRCQAITEQFESTPMRGADKQRQPHIGYCGFRMDKRLQTKRENNRRTPTDAFLAKPQSTEWDRYREECGRHGRREARREIVFAKDAVAHCLRPVGEWRFVQALLVVEVGNDI